MDVRCVASALAIASTAITRPLHAQGGPPLETDDPGTPGAGHSELNIALEAEREGGGTAYDTPRFDFDLGIGARVQLKAEVPWRVVTARSNRTKTGLGNLAFGVKWRFAEWASVTVSTYPQATLGRLESSRTRGVADSGSTVLLPVEVAWQGGRLSLGAELGYERGQGEEEIVYGIAAGHQTLPRLELLGECHGTGATDLSGQGVRCGVGFRWELRQAVSVLTALGAGVGGLADYRPHRRLYTGAQLRW